MHQLTGLKASILILAAIFLCGCETTTTTTPKPNVEPVRTSNRATIKSVGQVRTHIKESQKASKAGGDALSEADKELEALLNEDESR